MSAGSSAPSLAEAEAKSSSVQPTVEPLEPLNKRSSSESRKHENAKGDEKNTFEEPVEVDADLEAEDDPEISEIPPEVRRVVSLHDDSKYLLT